MKGLFVTRSKCIIKEWNNYKALELAANPLEDLSKMNNSQYAAVLVLENIKIKSIDVLPGFGLAILVIYLVHRFLMIDACLDMGGAIEPDTGVCMNENDYELRVSSSGSLFVLYLVLGLIVTVVSALIIKAIRTRKAGLT